MADKTKIEWADATLNYMNGCTVHSPGCKLCYAMKQAHRFPVRQGLTIKTKGGMVWTGEVRENPAALIQAMRWKRGRVIFWNAHGDLFHENVTDEQIDRQMACCAMTPQHIHLILTKRDDRMLAYFSDSAWRDRVSMVINNWPSDEIFHGNEFSGDFDILMADNRPLRNVWLGVSVEDQVRADERRENFRATPAAHKFVSYEPAIGAVDWTGWDFVNWFIGGGESGPGARVHHPQWHRDTRDHAAEIGADFMFKQWGKWVPAGHPEIPLPKSLMSMEHMTNSGRFPDGQVMVELKHGASNRELDGRTYDWRPFA